MGSLYFKPIEGSIFQSLILLVILQFVQPEYG